MRILTTIEFSRATRTTHGAVDAWTSSATRLTSPGRRIDHRSYPLTAGRGQYKLPFKPQLNGCENAAVGPFGMSDETLTPINISQPRLHNDAVKSLSCLDAPLRQSAPCRYDLLDHTLTRVQYVVDHPNLAAYFQRL